MTNPKVSVIIVNWNGKHLLENCLTSVFNQAYSNYEVVLVDNASTDDSVEYVRENFPDTKIIVSNENLGWSGGSNIGIEKTDGELIVLLNNDTIVDKNWLEELVRAVIDGEEIVAAGSRVFDEEKITTLNLVGVCIPTFSISDKITPTFFPAGVSMICKRDLVDIPTFDPDYFMYDDDIYFGWYMRLKGYEIVYAPSSTLEHLESASAKKVRGLIPYFEDRNRLLNVLLFYEFSTLLKVFPLLIVSFAFNILSNPRDRLKIIPYTIKNMGAIRKKRRRIQGGRRIRDKDIIKYMTYKLSGEVGFFYNTVNKLVYWYCRLMKLHTYEFNRGHEKRKVKKK